MKQYFEVVVEYRNEDENGKTKKSKETVLVDSISVTESEAKLIDHLRKQGEIREFTVLASKESKVKEVI